MSGSGIAHEITVKELKVLLEQLQDDDLLIPNKVANLLICRQPRGSEVYERIGFIDLCVGCGDIVMFE